MDAKLKAALLAQINTPMVNIRAGIAYLLNRLSRSDLKSIRSDTDKPQYEYTVVPGDNLSKIAKQNGTTVEELKKSNPNKSAIIRLGEKLEYHKAKIERVITGWHPFTTLNIAKRYNFGD